MSRATRRLGRGLDSLVSNLGASDLAPAEKPGVRVAGSVPGAGAGNQAELDARMVPVASLRPNPLQPRKLIPEESVKALARSIERDGILQPLTARVVGDTYEIIAGERRFSAAKLLGLARVPVVVRSATDEQMLELALIENLQREDLNAIDRAAAYREFCTRFSLRPEEVATRLAEDRTTVVNYLRLLDLPESIQRLVATGALSMGHARCLAGVTDDAQRITLAEAVTNNQLSVRALEEIIRRERRKVPGDESAPKGEATRSNHLKDLERRFEEALKTKVTIHEGRRSGSGRIVIEFYSLDDFDRLATGLGVAAE